MATRPTHPTRFDGTNADVDKAKIKALSNAKEFFMTVILQWLETNTTTKPSYPCDKELFFSDRSSAERNALLLCCFVLTPFQTSTPPNFVNMMWWFSLPQRPTYILSIPMMSIWRNARRLTRGFASYACIACIAITLPELRDNVEKGTEIVALASTCVGLDHRLIWGTSYILTYTERRTFLPLFCMKSK